MYNIRSLTLVHEGNDEGLLSLAAEPGNRENHAFLRQETPVEYTGTMEWWEDVPPLGAEGGLNLCRLEPHPGVHDPRMAGKIWKVLDK